MALALKAVELPTGVTLPYVEQGDPAGIPVLFLHGFLDSWRSFELVLTHLPDSLHAIAFTQRGHGDASRPIGGYGVPDFTADLTAFLNTLQLRRAVIVGHSMGSAIAQRFAIDYPARTIGLVLIGASASLRSSPSAREFWDSVLAELRDPVDPVFVAEGLKNMLVQPLPQERFAMLVAESTKVPVFVWRATLEARWHGEGDFAGELSKISTPTLIVWGDQDPRYPRVEQEAIAAEIKEARLVVYHGAGHLLHLEEPDRFASDLVEFIGSLEHAHL